MECSCISVHEQELELFTVFLCPRTQHQMLHLNMRLMNTCLTAVSVRSRDATAQLNARVGLQVRKYTRLGLRRMAAVLNADTMQDAPKQAYVRTILSFTYFGHLVDSCISFITWSNRPNPQSDRAPSPDEKAPTAIP